MSQSGGVAEQGPLLNPPTMPSMEQGMISLRAAQGGCFRGVLLSEHTQPPRIRVPHSWSTEYTAGTM